MRQMISLMIVAFSSSGTGRISSRTLLSNTQTTTLADYLGLVVRIIDRKLWYLDTSRMERLEAPFMTQISAPCRLIGISTSIDSVRLVSPNFSCSVTSASASLGYFTLDHAMNFLVASSNIPRRTIRSYLAIFLSEPRHVGQRLFTGSHYLYVDNQEVMSTTRLYLNRWGHTALEQFDAWATEFV